MEEPSPLKAVLSVVVFKALPSMSGGEEGREIWCESSPEERRDLEVMEWRGLKEEATGILEEELRSLEVLGVVK